LLDRRRCLLPPWLGVVTRLFSLRGFLSRQLMDSGAKLLNSIGGSA